MTKEDKERIFGKSHPVDVDAFGEYLNNCKLDINKYANGKPKGLMLKQASSPSFQRLHNAIQKLSSMLNEQQAIYRTTENPSNAAFAQKSTAEASKGSGVNYSTITPQRPNTSAVFTEANNNTATTTTNQPVA